MGKKDRKGKRNKKNQKKLILEKKLEETTKKRKELEKDINNTLDGLTVDELTELETLGDFSKEALDWIRRRKMRKKARKAQEEFERRIRCSDEVIRRTNLVGKIMGFRNGSYTPKTRKEAEEFRKEIEQDIEREERLRERELGDERSSKGKTKSEDERTR